MAKEKSKSKADASSSAREYGLVDIEAIPRKDRMSLEQAAEYLPCSYSNAILLKNKALEGRFDARVAKQGKNWYFHTADMKRIREAGVVKGLPKRLPAPVEGKSQRLAIELDSGVYTALLTHFGPLGINAAEWASKVVDKEAREELKRSIKEFTRTK